MKYAGWRRIIVAMILCSGLTGCHDTANHAVNRLTNAAGLTVNAIGSKSPTPFYRTTSGGLSVKCVSTGRSGESHPQEKRV